MSLAKQYVSRGGEKLAGAAAAFKLDFKDNVVLDVGSSTGGFTDYALQNGAQRIIAVDAGAHQMHTSLRDNPRVQLHEKTDIRDFKMSGQPDTVLIDVSFISLRAVLPAVAKLVDPKAQIIALLKPQFEAQAKQLNRGIVKNETMRRQILKDFEVWAKGSFIIENKADSLIDGGHGNLERFYLLRIKH